jgi:transcription initiation factor IIF auxiliary subunit
MEKLAEALPQLADDDLLQVVQMVHDNKTDETYTKNDVESKCPFAASPNLQICISSLLL